MDAIKLLQNNSDILIGVGAGVLLGPSIDQKLGDVLSVGTYTSTIIPLGVAFGALMLGKSKKSMAVSFAAVEIARALSGLFPNITSSI